MLGFTLGLVLLRHYTVLVENRTFFASIFMVAGYRNPLAIIRTIVP